MKNKEIASILKLSAQLMALHDENPFKVKMYESAAELVKNLTFSLSEINASELENYDGIGKKIAANITEIIEHQEFSILNELLAKTPTGLIEMLNIKGVGIKKVKSLWEELEIESLEQLLLACQQGKVANLKGFGIKTQDKIVQIVQFSIENRGKLLYADAEELSNSILEKLNNSNIIPIGELARKCTIISKLSYLVPFDFNFNTLHFLNHNSQNSSPWNWRGNIPNSTTQIEFIKSKNWESDTFIHTSSEEHLSYEKNGKTLLQFSKENPKLTDVSIYNKFDLPIINQGIREGSWVFNASAEKLNNLVQNNDIKGVLHNHSVYSDGENTIE